MLENMNKILEHVNDLKLSFHSMVIRRKGGHVRQRQGFNNAINAQLNANANANTNANEAAHSAPKAKISNESALDIAKSLNQDVSELVNTYSIKHGLKPELVKSLIAAASGNNPTAVGKNGNLGLMQVSPVVFNSLGLTNPFDPRQNIEAGTKHLADMIKQNGNSLSLGLAAYGINPSQLGQICGFNPYSVLLQPSPALFKGK